MRLLRDSTEHDLMLAAKDAEVIADLSVPVVEYRIGAGVAAGAETTRHCNYHVMGNVTVRIDADIRRSERRGAHAMDSRQTSSQTKLVNDVRAEQICRADRQRVRRVVVTRRGRGKQVVIEIVGNLGEIPGKQVTAEERVFRAGLIVDSAHVLPVVAVIDIPVVSETAFVFRSRKFRRDG